MKYCFIFFLILISLTAFSQGPIDGYMKNGGEADFAFSYGYDHYEKYFLGKVLQDTFNRTYHSASLFIAYGFENNLGFVASIPYMRADKDNKGFQDAQFFLKYRPLSKKMIKGQLNLILAGGVTTSISNYKISPESDNPIGEKPTILEASTVIQHNFKSGLFLMGKTGLSYKIRPITQVSIPNLFRIGYAHSKFYTDFWIEGLFAINAEANDLPFGQQGSTSLKFGGTLYAPINNFFGVFINGSYTPWGRNVSQSPRLGAGFVLKILPKTTK